MALADFDDDGWLDIASGSYTGNIVALLRNPGLTGDRWTQFNIDHKVVTTRLTRIGDFNGDGWPDVVVGAQGTGTDFQQIAWYENPGGLWPASLWSSIINDDAYRWTKHIIDTVTLAPA